MRTKAGFIVAAMFFFAAGMSVNAATSFFGSWVECTRAAPGICLDGTWWQHLNPASRQPVAEGMISSYIAGYRLAAFNVYSEWLDAYGTGPQTSADKAFLARFRSNGGGIPVFDRSASAYTAAINRFYEKYPSKRTLEVAGVLRCLAARAQASCDEVGRSALLPWPTGP